MCTTKLKRMLFNADATMIAKHGYIAVGPILCFACLLIAPSQVRSEPTEGRQTTVEYTEDSSVFPNPERGWFIFNELKPTHPGGVNRWANDELLTKYHAVGYRLAKHILRIPTTSQPIPKEFLNDLGSELDRIRSHGFKVFCRFNYNWDHGISKEDAPLDVVLGHLDQLQPIFHQNKDVLAWLEIGFLGYWGEMHTSTNGHIIPRTVGLSDSGKRIVRRILQVLPKDRMAGVRYPNVIYRDPAKYGSLGFRNPLNAQSAYSGADQSRLGTWYANFGAGEKLWHKDEEYAKNWAPSTEFVPMWAHCDHFQTVSMDANEWREDARVFHYVALSNPDDEPHTLDIAQCWRDAGVYDDFSKKLGHRYRLLQCTTDKKASPGKALELQLLVRNDGWARPVNPRILEIVLRNQQNGSEYAYEVTPPVDLRLWFPGPESTKNIHVAVPIPDRLPVGIYDTFLNLPDPIDSIRGNSDYSIRLANKRNGKSIWDSTTGYNDLGMTVQIER